MTFPIKADFYHSIKAAYHSRLASVVLWLFATLVIAVLLSGQFSARQPATVALDIGISAVRLVVPLLMILLAQELFSREFEKKLYLNTLTYPRSRPYWLLGRVAVMCVVCIATILLMGTILALLVLYTGHGYKQATPVSLGFPYIITLLYIGVDSLVAIAMSTLLAICSSTSSFVLIGTIGFLLIARSYTPIIELLRSNPSVISNFADPRLYQDSLGLLAFILPDLGRLDVRMIALYNRLEFLPSDWPLLIIATLAYSTALLGLAVWVLNKREFN